MLNIIFIILGYLLGSLSSAILLAKLMNFPDPRTQGSGNAGTTNVVRSVGKKEGAFVLAGDVIKGLLAVLIAKLLGVSGIALGFVAVAVVVGHIFPVFFNFKGGKGVAPAIGVLLGLSFWVGILVVIAWIAVAAIFRYASLASIVAVATAPIFLLAFVFSMYAFPVFLITVLIIWKHMDNINRLRAGTEDKIQF